MGEEGKDQLSENGKGQKEVSQVYEDVPPMPLMALNHVSRLCKSVKASVEFYVKVLGFVVIERPPSLDFNGACSCGHDDASPRLRADVPVVYQYLIGKLAANVDIPGNKRRTTECYRLFNYGIGVHLVQKQGDEQIPDADPNRLDPMDNHISFQCEDMNAMERRLKDVKIKYMKRTINEEEGAPIDQLFFKDPDGFMIEICNCENLELVPAGALGRIKLPGDRHNPPLQMN
ncbi:hypothetical protein LUZ61_000812 [Rhynchospora tenuis]|uniref:VOC domain-containing protein n=1 Tax=Rhynchospora tenuis TaxID=198213 RepID=A0AAD6EQ73_9POAL|nr:hypothetical protein LUZ61_000812 [Rhynchospora tenuis]